MGTLMAAYNNRVHDDFDGLSPNQMSLIDSQPFGKNGVSIKNAQAGENTRFVRQAAYFLNLLKDSDLRLTAASYLPPKIVQGVYEQHIIQTEVVDWNIERSTKKGKKFSFKESEVWTIKQMHAVCEAAELIEQVSKTIRLTEKGMAALESHALFEPLFTAFCEDYNWAYTERYSFCDDVVGPLRYPFTFYLLAKYGQKKQSAKFYAQKYKAANFPDEYNDDDYDFFTAEYTHRTFDKFLVEFDMVQTQGGILATPLFRQILNIALVKKA
jgi:hypothetical protein